MIDADQQTGNRVVALIYDGLCTFEYGIVAEVFGLYRPELGGHLYRFSSVAVEPQPVRAAGGLMVSASGTQQDLNQADTIIVPGWRGKDEPVPETLTDSIIAAHQRGARLLSICSGIYVLAAAGLLTNRAATTHWRYREDFSAKHPEVNIDENALYIEDGAIVTSAGSSAGIDACLHIVRTDYGAKIANTVAKRLVMHAHRDGGQSQFIEQPLPKPGPANKLARVIDEVRSKLADTHKISSMAEIAGMSSRTFQRRFLAYTGMPAMQWLSKERIQQSCFMLETTDTSIDEISQSVGFGNAEAMRYHFRQSLDISPIDYRRRFRSANQR
ncbi:MAG: transcriptional regulator FtrA [Granulosicoccus sp.]